MTDIVSETLSSALRPICGELTHLPEHLVRAAIAVAAPAHARTEDVGRDLRCTLERHVIGDHFAFVLDRGLTTTSVWTRWTRGNQPGDVFVQSDCDTASSPETGREPCGEFAGHPGGHTFDIDDPWTRTPAARR